MLKKDPNDKAFGSFYGYGNVNVLYLAASSG
ncbi:hypothetical protein RKD56_001366 [Priestia megaterium]|jgi:hypothetical protein|nr:hypothetical protein SRABI82_01754 [Priestia megaterium]